MGDEEFTKEELEILGESEEQGQDTQDTSEETGEAAEESETEQTTETEEKTEETAQAEEQENLVPQSRVDQIVREREELKRKNDLLRRDPQAYYEKYPDEKPKTEGETQTTMFGDVAHMRVQGGQYDGKTLEEVYQTDPFSAMALYHDYRDQQREAQRSTRDTQERLKRESEQEVNAFTEQMSKEMFGKEKGKLETKETKQLDTFIDGILNWMEETGRANSLADAYILMNHQEILKAAQVNSTKALIEALSTGTVKAATTQKSDEEKSGYGRFMEYSPEQLASHLDTLSDAQVQKFMKDAPAKLREKFPQAFAAWE